MTRQEAQDLLLTAAQYIAEGAFEASVENWDKDSYPEYYSVVTEVVETCVTILEKFASDELVDHMMFLADDRRYGA